MTSGRDCRIRFAAAPIGRQECRQQLGRRRVVDVPADAGRAVHFDAADFLPVGQSFHGRGQDGDFVAVPDQLLVDGRRNPAASAADRQVFVRERQDVHGCDLASERIGRNLIAWLRRMAPVAMRRVMALPSSADSRFCDCTASALGDRCGHVDRDVDGQVRLLDDLERLADPAGVRARRRTGTARCARRLAAGCSRSCGRRTRRSGGPPACGHAARGRPWRSEATGRYVPRDRR